MLGGGGGIRTTTDDVAPRLRFSRPVHRVEEGVLECPAPTLAPTPARPPGASVRPAIRGLSGGFGATAMALPAAGGA